MTKGHGSVQEFGLSERRGQAVSRRRFLSASALAGASLGAVACTHPVAAKPVTTPTLASGRVWPSPPAGPAPRWTAAIAGYDTGGSSGLGLASLGGTIVAWYGTKAWGFNAATGFVAWTQSVGAYSSSSHPAWCGVFGETLIGIVTAPSPTLIGYNAAGRVISLPIARALDAAGINPVDDAFGCIGVSNGVAVIIAVQWTFEYGQPMFSEDTIAVGIDLADGTRLWSRVLNWDQSAIATVQQSAPVLGGAVSGEYCYLQDGTTTIAVDLRTGARRWSNTQTPPPAYTGIPLMTVANGALVMLSPWEYLSLDAGSGARLWSRSDATVDTFASGNNCIYVLIPHPVGIEAIDCRTGDSVWSTATPSPAALTSLSGKMSVSPSLVAMPLVTLEANGDTVKASGVLVLSAADGRPLWAYQRGDPVVGQFSPVLAAGSAVYGLGTGGGGVYDPMPLYAFPPTMT